ncbi:hypothetical protein HYS93_04430 [Candidatus Daviesbacteria bacterium]|nr:hypothetical protein [Candidatus Daviesbacteria bacterium]
MKNPIGIVGYGIVGQAVEYGFKNEPIFIYDKFKPFLSLEEVCQKGEFIFLCVPTPILDDHSGIDLSIVEENVEAIAKLIKDTDKILVIKSTVVPGTTSALIKRYPKVSICFNPEFLTEANFLEDFVKADRCIIGAENDLISRRLVALFRKHFPIMPIFQTDPTTAEMVKYMANCYLAAKVTFANEMYDICQSLGISYPEVKKLVVSDKRIYDSHLNITSQRGFGGKCLPKDLLALRALGEKFKVDTTFLDTVWNKNIKMVKFKDWEEIPFAVSSKKTKN